MQKILDLHFDDGPKMALIEATHNAFYMVKYLNARFHLFR